MSGISVGICNLRDRTEAEALLAAHPYSSFALDRRWRRAVRQTYGLDELLMTARRGGAIVGVAPWTVMNSLLAGRYLLLGPFASYADIVAEDEDVRFALLRETYLRARIRSVAYLHHRAHLTSPRLKGLPGSVDDHRFATWTLDLQAGREAAWASLASKAKQQIRRGRRADIRSGEVKVIPALLDVFRRGTRSLGSPFHGERFFRHLAHAWGPDLCCCLARTASGRPAAASLNIIHRGVFHYVFGQNVHQLRSTDANSHLCWAMIKLAIERGCKRIDWGRSELGSGSAHFKKSWGSPLPLQDTVVLSWRNTLPDLTPTNPSYRILQRIWSRLPLALIDQLGPLFIRGIG